ncbi:T9SS type A sorting domain-containing protein [Psychroserpens sp. Hel_I_66]|uniref:T9SS type A sorting domain-containing protein n=1 Tax=Psychroserpens sp. Hel_I_66 TaxID=1250004 RepID=UPI000649026D|nr:T9SS type A sorting domain-containing protein [Psychroserpens sp. Hel_I_66]
MKKIIKSTLFLSLFFTMAFSLNSSAQELMIEVPFDTQIQSSTEIIEGKVISKASFWDNNHYNIYTVNTIEVYKIFKGENVSETIEIVTPGGTVGNDSEIVTPSLTLNIGDIGMFMLKDNNVAITNQSPQNKFMPFASSQGFYKYNLLSNEVFNPFVNKKGITTSFYNAIKAVSNTPNFIKVSNFDVLDIYNTNIANRNTTGSIEITSFAPTIVNGGVRDILVISGAGFGNTQGNVNFRDANSGGSQYYTALDSQIQSWSDSQIVLEVPSRAGTGDIQVVTSTSTTVTSSNNLTVFYSQINPGNGIADFQSQHFDLNGSGGYTWQMHTEFDNNTAANASFVRAFDTWVCSTGINWEIGAVTTVDIIADDDINIIRFDNGSELPDGVLGRCTSRFGSCNNPSSPGGIDIVVTELDIVFNDAFTGDFSVLSWEFGPGTASGFEVDFESVAVHELGHGHQLAHIINPGEVMHFSIANGQNSRNLGSSDIAGAADVMDRNLNTSVCGTDSMTASSCSTLGMDEAILAEHISIYPNPAKHILNIDAASHLRLESAIIFDVQGRKVMVRDLNKSDNTLHAIDVSQLQAGVYFIKIGMDSTSTTKKFIVE